MTTSIKSVYDQLYKLSEKHLKYYREDLKIDKENINSYPDIRFLHFKGEL